MRITHLAWKLLGTLYRLASSRVSGKLINYGVTRIPSLFDGGLVARRAGRAISTQGIFIQVRAAKMHNTLVLLVWLLLNLLLAFILH